MSSFDDQYDAPLSGPERARVQALELALRNAPGDAKADDLVEAARAFERFIIGDRATGVQGRIDAAYGLAAKLLEKAVDDFREAGGTPWAEPGDAEVVPVDAGPLRELVKMLSGLAGGPPF